MFHKIAAVGKKVEYHVFFFTQFTPSSVIKLPLLSAREYEKKEKKIK